ncbi:hypothetical protein TRFO_03138 [Tritrichomonas foetus]|uniref:Uncharacterized protein n=1 Tax=Tritrichomonas foetus TaxID=1144522 RepID=A0A1J4KS80_9EUKA|nr:hypothetical protein TRFO_03138 [Tritrichomonas foetus]|eukprot:OHT14115.1 hypothetical protein TRFO_03138 [Tritrichomonas foetus]
MGRWKEGRTPTRRIIITDKEGSPALIYNLDEKSRLIYEYPVCKGLPAHIALPKSGHFVFKPPKVNVYSRSKQSIDPDIIDNNIYEMNVSIWKSDLSEKCLGSEHENNEKEKTKKTQNIIKEKSIKIRVNNNLAALAQNMSNSILNLQCSQIYINKNTNKVDYISSTINNSYKNNTSDDHRDIFSNLNGDESSGIKGLCQFTSQNNFNQIDIHNDYDIGLKINDFSEEFTQMDFLKFEEVIENDLSIENSNNLIVDQAILDVFDHEIISNYSESFSVL